MCVSFPGFRYGSDIVPFSKVDQEQMKYKHDGKCFAVLGFAKQNTVRGSYYSHCPKTTCLNRGSGRGKAGGLGVAQPGVWECRVGSPYDLLLSIVSGA